MTFIICCITLVYLITGIFYFGSKIKGYSHGKDTISELGETGSACEKQVAFGLFLPTGILLAIVAILAKENINVMGLAMALAAGYIVAAFFPCDPGSPSSGTWKQQLHNAGGFIEYAGGIAFIMKASEDDLQLWPVPFKTIGFIIIACINHHYIHSQKQDKGIGSANCRIVIVWLPAQAIVLNLMANIRKVTG